MKGRKKKTRGRRLVGCAREVQSKRSRGVTEEGGGTGKRVCLIENTERRKEMLQAGTEGGKMRRRKEGQKREGEKAMKKERDAWEWTRRDRRKE